MRNSSGLLTRVVAAGRVGTEPAAGANTTVATVADRFCAGALPLVAGDGGLNDGGGRGEVCEEGGEEGLGAGAVRAPGLAGIRVLNADRESGRGDESASHLGSVAARSSAGGCKG